MSDILFQYDPISPTTWAYVSSLLMIGLYFKFSRFWSVRNFDLVLLILLAPGLLMVIKGQSLLRPVAQSDARDVEVPASPPPSSQQPMPDVTIDAFGNDFTAAGEQAEFSSFESPPTTVLASFQNIRQPSGDPDGVTPPGVDQGDTSDPAADVRVEFGSPPLGAGGEVEIVIDDPLAEEITPQQRRTERGQQLKASGYIWLFSISVILLVRLLLDPTMVRRPLLEPNLSVGGLTFIGCALFVFLMANVITSTPTEDDLRGAKAAESLLARRDTSQDYDTLARYGPGLSWLYMLPTVTTSALVDPPAELPQLERKKIAYGVTAKVMAILSHLAVVIGMVLIGYWHFNNIRMGIGAAALYLMMPYMAEMTGRVDHAMPAALLVWALALYRRPIGAGIFLGLAAGVVYYPLFLLPLWISFYWQRGLLRFVGSAVTMWSLVALSLIFTSSDVASFWLQFKAMCGIRSPAMFGLEGIWGNDLGAWGWDSVYRIPILAAFIAMAGSFALWPARKHLGTLLCCTAAIMLAIQFWHGYGGGTYMAWYLPLLLLTVFRPNLEDRVAISVLDKGRWPRLAALSKAA